MVATANAVASGGVAPGGFGLGTATPTSLTTGAQVNALRESGWYAANISGAEAVNAGDCPLTYFGLLHLARSTKRMVQIGFSESTSWKAAVIMREMINDSEAWEPWEWLNPPMVEGMEYRTTERFNGKPVYTVFKVYNTSEYTFTNNIATIPYGISNLNRFIYVFAMYDGCPIPMWRTIPDHEVYVDRYGGSGLTLYAGPSYQGKGLGVIYKYTKTAN